MVNRGTSVRIRFGSPFSSEKLLYVDCLVTLSLTINETLKWFSHRCPLSLMQESFWWWQCSSDRYTISLFLHLHTPLLPVPNKPYGLLSNMFTYILYGYLSGPLLGLLSLWSWKVNALTVWGVASCRRHGKHNVWRHGRYLGCWYTCRHTLQVIFPLIITSSLSGLPSEASHPPEAISVLWLDR